MVALASPWVFTQRHPLNLKGFVDEAKARGFDLNAQLVRELYRHRLLIPFASIQDRRTPSQALPKIDEPVGGSSILWAMREAREDGGLYDLGLQPFRPRLPFIRHPHFSTRWWNGLIYSWHQLHILWELRDLLAHRRYRRRGDDFQDVLPAPHSWLVEEADAFRRIATMATALEARYLPKLDPEWVHLSNVKVEVWEQYRDAFNPVEVSRVLSYSGEQARDDAERLLLLAHSIDPLGRSWGRLARRAPKKSWEDLKGAALGAMDLRQTAEILLLFYEDLAEQSAVPELPEIPSMAFHPLVERISHRDTNLDEDLVSLGISPHPRVVLAVEGESEQVHVPKIWSELGYRDAPELMRLLKLGGADKDLQKVAALAAAPLIAGRKGDKHWDLLKPPTCLMVAADPEGAYFAPGKVAKTRANILSEIRDVLKAQGAKTVEEELDLLVHIHTWSAACYEFAHFDDDELADGITAIHRTVNGLTRDQLVKRLSEVRARYGTANQKTDIKNVWERWSYKPSKVDLANQLWPTLQEKIQRRLRDKTAPIPEVAEVVERAHATAQRWRYQNFALTAV
ncbi:hypothetical protein [Amycolatopsis sp. NBC_01286]|uniref:hypothetical protein n=1 Tax=Amycolatopsis sp. NBC_01286 TaxID=2903560 RepID=UPI002E12ED04|nr:hypothetical protein OG570_00135 [Amycolatopsis sp. NBC_01286]